MREHLAKNPHYELVIAGTVLFAASPQNPTAQAADQQDKLLLLQRAVHMGRPLTWEIPGGSVEAQDESVLHGMVRELWEETGLLVTRVVRSIGAG